MEIDGVPGVAREATLLMLPSVQRLGRNRHGYEGEHIEVDEVFAATRAAAKRHGWATDSIEPAELSRPAFSRPAATAGALRCYLSAGIHGDEPAGPLAALRLLEENRWPDLNLWLVPCLNPAGFRARTRGNAEGIDVNRDYRHFRTAEARGHVEWLQRQSNFELTLMLHEDWESHGFYTYEVNPRGAPSLAPAMIEAVRPFCPVDDSTVIDGREVSEPGIIRPLLTPAERPEWPEALWLIVNKSPLSYTMEAPSDWPLSIRVNALVLAVRAALAHFSGSQPG
jgi:protein MpaA